MTADDLIRELALAPHPEGGWYREVYRSSQRVQSEQGDRSALTTIYYLLEHGQLSRWHVVEADEVWHFYAGAPLELLAYDPGPRRLTRNLLGAPTGPAVGVRPAAIAPVRISPAAVAPAAPQPGSPHAAAAVPPQPGSPHAAAAVPPQPGSPHRRAAVPPQPDPPHRPVAVISRGVWQAARSLGEFSLLGCTVGPGFEFEDFRFVAAIPGHQAHFDADLAAFAQLL